MYIIFTQITDEHSNTFISVDSYAPPVGGFKPSETNKTQAG